MIVQGSIFCTWNYHILSLMCVLIYVEKQYDLMTERMYSQSFQLLQVLEGSPLDGGDFILHKLPEGETPGENETR